MRPNANLQPNDALYNLYVLQGRKIKWRREIFQYSSSCDDVKIEFLCVNNDDNN
ncbi:hypothetical protein X777_11388 [Ooceraea biroi]|uniref:Uncharacterized protein n=1 Tax=Ooceraea biroi TaxID=2015173 RepID=A0A026W1F0_OOCBI|nr:hypothetical protein X777_11388 [Ooceraea biroi]